MAKRMVRVLLQQQQVWSEGDGEPAGNAGLVSMRGRKVTASAGAETSGRKGEQSWGDGVAGCLTAGEEGGSGV